MRCQPALISLSYGEKSLLGQYLPNSPGGGSSLCLCHHLKSLTESSVWPSALSLYKNQSWDNSLGLFSLKISWELARVFLMPGLLNSSSDSNYDIGGPVHHFGHFSFLAALIRLLSRLFDIFLYPYTLFTNDFFPIDSEVV
jgi:hypothetical protein